MNPTNTVIVEVNTLLGEYKAYSSAVTALAKKQKCLRQVISYSSKMVSE
jgi:hypothetical protein